jgi:hypothetical protein
MTEYAEGQTCRALTRRLLPNNGMIEIGQMFQTARELQTHFVNPMNQAENKGLLFGLIQSGKTNRILASIAMAADNGFRIFILLTSDNRWLYEQTLSRIRRSITTIRTIGKSDWGGDTLSSGNPSLISNRGLITVATKNAFVLEQLQDFLASEIDADLPAVIYDDEADQASLNTSAGDPDSDPSAINSAISSIRRHFKTLTYLQVTATPQALLLQRVEGDYRPDFTVSFDPGPDYVGSDSFFAEADGAEHLREIPAGEIQRILTTPFDGTLNIPDGLKRAISTFYVAAAIKLLGGTDPNGAYTMLCHISQRQDAHAALRAYINGFVARATDLLIGGDVSSTDYLELTDSLRAALNDIYTTTSDTLLFEDVLQEISSQIASTHIQLLSASAGGPSPSFDVPFNILIGGNRLGRGVTIPGLLVTYYGREVKSPQIDTIMQHSRMYGYRRPDLDVTRCFLTPDLRTIFYDIHQSNRQLLALVRNEDETSVTPVLIRRSKDTPLRATRNMVLDLGSISTYLPGSGYFPRAPVKSSVAPLDEALRPYLKLQTVQRVPIDLLLMILNLTRSDAGGFNGAWNDDAIRACLQKLRQSCNNEGGLVARADRHISFPFNALLSSNDQKIFLDDLPTLTMYRVTGAEDEGWGRAQDGAGARWIPHLRFPSGRHAYIFTAD